MMVNETTSPAPTAPAPPEPPPPLPDVDDPLHEADVITSCQVESTTSTALDRIGSRLLAAVASRNGIVIATPANNGGHRAWKPAATTDLSVRKKRGRPPKGSGGVVGGSFHVAKKIKKEDEDVCFICFDGGSLVLCDRRDCPKAYHPACVKRDESFFKRRVRWNCGWHLCNICQKNAVFLCYTCPYSLCKTCVKQADIYCVRGNKGFCKTCMTTVSLIENITEASKDMGHVDFDDIYSWEYLFKVYWVLLKQKESLTLEELTRATNPWKVQMSDQKNAYSSEVCDVGVNRIPDVIVSKIADVDVSRTADITVSRYGDVSGSRTADVVSQTADVAAGRTADVAVSRTADVAVSRTADVAVGRTADVAVGRTADGAVGRTADGAVSRTPDATVCRNGDVAVSKTEDVAVNRTEDVALSRTEDVAVSRIPDATVTTTPDVTVNRTSDLSCSTFQPTLNEGHVELNGSKRRKTRKQPLGQIKSQEKVIQNHQYAIADWGSEELLEFVAHMKNGDTSALTQFDVQALLLDYIKKNNLRDPLRKSHIICDRRLVGLFGKVRVGHFEMLGLLERHFKEDFRPNGVVLGAAVEASSSQLENEWHTKETPASNKQKKRPGRKRGDGRARQININLDSYAAIDMHNINLIYLKRSLMESLVDATDQFHDNVVGSVVRIRIHGNELKQDMYRLVRVVGTSKAAEPYQIGEKSTRLMLKILNLDKIEDVAIDLISNQDFSEEECRRLRQSIKCGLMGRMTVGEVRQKATALQAFRLHDILEAEILKLNHLRDRASEMGHRKELRECFEKLEVLKSPEERQRRLQNIPEVHADPRMDPSCPSDEDSELPDTNKQGHCTAPKSVNLNSKPMELITPERGDTPYSVRAKVLRSSCAQKKSMIIKKQPSKEDTPSKSCESTPSSLELETHAARILEELSKQVDPSRLSKQEPETSANNPSQVASSDASVTSSSTGTVLSCEYSELEKLWHYQDPTGKIQGPFCMLQLRKWNSSGYFPPDLRVWKINESQHSSVFLSDALSVHCHNSDYHFQCGHIFLGSQDTKVTSDGRKPEHDGQMSSTVNSELKGHERNEGCDSGMTEEAACSGDKIQPKTERNSRKGGDVQCSQISSEENQKSPSGETSHSKVEVDETSLVSSTTEPFTEMSPSHEHKVSNVPESPSQDGNEDLTSSKMETGKVPASATSVKNSASSSWGVSCPHPQPEGEDSKEGGAEDKDDYGDLKHEATRDKELLEISAVPDQILNSNQDGSPGYSKSEFSDVPNQTRQLDDKDENSLTGAKSTMTLNLPGWGSDMPSEDGSPGYSKSEFSDVPNQTRQLDDKDENSLTGAKSTMTLNLPGWGSDMPSEDGGPGRSRNESSHLSHQTQPPDDKDENSQATAKATTDSNLPNQTPQLDDKDKRSQTEAEATMAVNLHEQDVGMSSWDDLAGQSIHEFSNMPKQSQVPDDKGKDSRTEAQTTMTLNVPEQDPSIPSSDSPAVQSTGEFPYLPNQTHQLEGKDKNSQSETRATMALNLSGPDVDTSSWDGSALENRSVFPKLPNQMQQLDDKDRFSLMEPDATMALNLHKQDSGMCRNEYSNMPNQTRGLKNKDKTSQIEAMTTVTLNLPVQDSGTTSWDAITSEMNFSVPISSTLPENGGSKVDMPMGLSVTPALPCNPMGVSWSTASSLVLDEPVNVSSEWAGYSHMHAKPCEGLENGLGTIPSIFDELFDGPIEFDTLGDQSVSDLLSEVEAMEMNGGMMPSPSNDCFSPLAGLSPPLEGGKSDAWRSACDIQFHSEPTPMGEAHHHFTVFGLDLNDCSTKPSNPCSSSSHCTVGGVMKLDLGSSHPSRAFPSPHHATSLPLPNLNLVSSSGSLGFEDVKPDYVNLNLQDLGSQGFSTASLALSSGVGPTINSVSVGEMKPVDVSMNRCDFIPQGQTLPVSSGSVDFLFKNRAVKTDVNETCVSRGELMSPVELPCPTKLSPSRSPPILAKPGTPSPKQGGEVNDKGDPQAELSLSSYSPPSSQPPLVAQRPPSISEMNPSRLPSPLPHQPSPLLSPPSPPTQIKETSSSPVEEGEVEPTADLLGIKQASHPSPQTSSPIEEGEVKPSSPLSNNKVEDHPSARSNLSSSTRVPSLKPPALDVPMSGRVPTREKSSFSPPGASPRSASSFSPPGSSPRSTKSTSWMTGQGNSMMTMTTGNRDGSHHIAASNHQGVIRACNQSRYQGVLGRPSGPKDRSHHPHPYQHPSVASPGFVKPSRQSWNRQPSFGSGGVGGSPRQQTSGHGRGQRVCKFYERGCCRKGASCNYLHPS